MTLSLPACLLLFAPSVLAWQGPPPAPVRVDAVRLESVQERRAVTGEVRAMRFAQVASEEAGRVVELTAREGTRVAANQVLARLSDTRLGLELGVLEAQALAAQATIEMRQAQLDKAALDLETVRALATRDAANKKEVSDRETALRVATSEHARAEADLATIAARRAELAQRVADMQIRAPFAGIVVTRRIELGEWLTVGAAVVELLSDSELEAWVEVPQRYVGAVTAERGPLELIVDATGAPLSLTEYRVIPVVDPRARTFSLVATLPAEAVAGLAPGMSVSAFVPTGAAGEHMTVASDALLRNDAGPYLWVARGTGEGPPLAFAVPVEVLFRSGGRAVVRAASLAPGELAVTEGGERLFPMTPLLPQDAAGDSPQ